MNSSLEPQFPLDGVSYPSAVDAALYLRTGAWHSRTLGEALRHMAALAPQQSALVTPAQRLSYGELDAASNALAHGLADLGLRPGDRAMFQMGSVIETAIALLACAKAAIVPVCALPQHRAHEIGALAQRTSPRAYFVQADVSAFDLAGFAEAMAREYAIPYVIAARDMSAGHPRRLRFEALLGAAMASPPLSAGSISISDVLMLQLSGGTTSTPKLIPRCHGEHLGQALAWAARTSMTSGCVSLYNMPLIHNAGLVAMFYPTLLAGGTFVLADRADPRQFFSLVERERVTHSLSIGPAAHKMLEYEGIREHDLSSLKLMTNFNGSRAMERHIGATCLNIYGITEGFIMSSTIRSSERIRFETVGWPVHDLDEYKIVEPGTDREMPPGEVGEFCFRGPSSIRGYYKGGDINRTGFTPDGFFRTGDLMVSGEHDDGLRCCAFHGRIKDNIDRGGEKIGAEEVEALIDHHPDVLDVKIVAMPDRLYGEKACAFLVLKPGAEPPTMKSLSEFLMNQGLAKYKLPERIELIDAIPMTHVGKADKQALRHLIRRKIESEAEALATKVAAQRCP